VYIYTAFEAMTLPSNQDLSVQQWPAIQHNDSFGDSNFTPYELNWLQGTEGFLTDVQDGIQESEYFTYPEPSLNNASVFASMSNPGASLSMSAVETPSGKDNPPKRSRGRPRGKEIQDSATIEVSLLYPWYVSLYSQKAGTNA
jgi:hypothetical protein